MQRIKTSESLKLYHSNLTYDEKQVRVKNRLDKLVRKTYTCVICDGTIAYKKATCSPECYSKHKSNLATKQKSHGVGKRGIYQGFQCDSTYELAFLIYHLDHGKVISRSTNSYPYSFEGKVLSYTPDFIVDEVEYEIKGYWTEKSKAKAVQHPQIVLVSSDGIKPYLEYVKTTYAVKNIVDMYVVAHTGQKKCLWCEEIYSYNYTKQKFCSPRCNALHRHSK